MATAVRPEMLALSGEHVEIAGRAGRLGAYLAGPDPERTPARTPLLLVHSMNAAGSAAEVRPVFEHERLSRTVLAVDMPGFGTSERSDRAYTPRLMTDAVHEAVVWLQERTGAAAVDVLGLSLSAEFVARAAVEAPARCRRLVLVSPTGFRGGALRYAPAGGSVGSPWLLHALKGPRFHDGGGWGETLFRALTRPAVVRYFLERTWGSKQIDEELWRYDLITTREPGAHFAPLHFLGAALFSTDVNALYEALTQPVWMSHGTRGDFTDYRGAHTVKQRTNWRVTEFKDTGALLYFEKRAAFCAALEEFLA